QGRLDRLTELAAEPHPDTPLDGITLPHPGLRDCGGLPEVPRFEILERVGQGGHAVVYKARQPGLSRVVALKMMREELYAGEADRARFRAEAQAIARLQHPNIVAVHDHGEHDGRPFLVMEFVAGRGLDRRLADGPLAVRAAAALVEALARAVHF